MECGTDFLGINDHNLFDVVRESLGAVKIKTQNIIDCKNDILFVWNALDQNILSLDLKSLKENPKHQALLPTDPPSYAVETLLVNDTASQVALSGPEGVSVLTLPQRWGKGGTFHGGKDSISCRCRAVDDRFFSCHPYIELKRVRWHPGSPNDSHLVVLSTENALRLYDITDEGPQLVKVWHLGPTPHGALSTAPKLPFLVGLGETAIDFDFTPAVIVSADRLESSPEQDDGDVIEWPILVLHGNGDVLKVTASLDSDSSECHVLGPLSMFPAAADNYGTEMCCLLVLHSMPPIVVIASSAGTLFHCLLLDRSHEEDDDNETWSRCGSNYSLHTPDEALYVLDNIELELGISLNDDDAVTCPIHLHRHGASSKMYLCTHVAGIHAVSLPVVSQLDNFIDAEEGSEHLHVPNLYEPSVMEYLVCTMISPSDNLCPILGLTFSQTPPLLLALLGTGELLNRPLPATLVEIEAQPENSPGEEEVVSPVKAMLKEPFDARIQNMLKHDANQPLLKLAWDSCPSSKEALELVSRSTQLLREEYVEKMEHVRDEIERRVSTLQTLKDHQFKELEALEAEKAGLQEAAETLAEKYEDAKEKQEELNKRATRVLRLSMLNVPTISDEEKEFSKELHDVQEKMSEFRKGLEQIRKKQSYQREQYNQLQAQSTRREVYIEQSRAATIRNTLSKMTEDINELVEMVNSIKSDLEDMK